MQTGGLLALIGQSAFKALLRSGVAFGLMLFKGLLKSGGIHIYIALSRQFHGHFNGEAKGVVKMKRGQAVYAVAGPEGGGRLVIFFQPLVKSARKTLLFHIQLLDYPFPVLSQLGILAGVFIYNYLGNSAVRAGGQFESFSIAHAAAYESAQHIALIYVAGRNSALVSQNKYRAADVIGYYSEGAGGFIVLAVSFA